MRNPAASPCLDREAGRLGDELNDAQPGFEAGGLLRVEARVGEEC
jgi:hypothetical protein